MSDAVRFLDSFAAADWVAILLIHRSLKRTRQSFTRIDIARSEAYQRGLFRQNLDGWDVYLGMNPLRENAKGRTKGDVTGISHLYLDCDDNGAEIVDQVLDDSRTPTPHGLVQTSEHRWQIVWSVSGFDAASAESVLRGLVHEFGADPATTDVTRVLRWPGFLNHKYTPPFRTCLTRYVAPTYAPADFAIFESSPCKELPLQVRSDAKKGVRQISQSERDWAWTLDQLRRGRSPRSIAEELAQRRPDKPKPLYYAHRTVSRAVSQHAQR